MLLQAVRARVAPLPRPYGATVGRPTGIPVAPGLVRVMPRTEWPIFRDIVRAFATAARRAPPTRQRIEKMHSDRPSATPLRGRLEDSE
jgi:hypothetical protein